MEYPRAAVDLDGDIGGFVQTFATGSWPSRTSWRANEALIQRPGGFMTRKPADLDLHGETAEHQLHALARFSLMPNPCALGGVFTRDSDARFGEAGASAMQWVTRAGAEGESA